MESVTKVQLGPALLASALDQCQDAVFVENEQRRVVYANAAACALLGYTLDELLSQAWADIHVELDGDHSTVKWFDGSHSRFEGHLRTRSGVHVPVAVSAVHRMVDGVIHRVLVARDVSDREAHLAELKRRDQELQAILDTFPFLVWWKDPEGVIRVANRQAALWAHQLEAQALIGKTDFQVLPVDLAQRYAQKDQWVMASGQVLCAEELYPDLPSGLMWTETWRAPLQLDGQLLGTVGFARDITDRKLTEQHLKQTLSLLQGVIDAFPDFLFESNREGRYLNVWTRTHTPEQLAASRDLLVGRTLDDVLSPESAATSRLAIEEADRDGVSFGKVIWIDSPEGIKWFELSISRMQVEEGDEPHFITVSRDVTSRMTLQAALAREEEKFRSLVEHSPDATARFAADLRCLYANPALTERMGGTASALLGKTPSEFIGVEAGQSLEAALRTVFQTAERSDMEMTWADAHGGTVCSLLSLSPEFDASNAVTSVLVVGRDITELRAYQDKIHQMAFYDPLTGLANRVLFNDRLAQMMAEASWHQRVGAVMVVDMDRFKQINDTLGHGAGDELLKEAAERLRQCVRSYDTVARLGGDEFGVLLPQVRDIESVSRVVHKVQSAFDRGFVLAGREVIVSCSIGISVFPQDGTDGDELIKHADSAMYFAKRSGRNGFRFYSKDLTDSAQERLTLEQALRRALERDELSLHFQPKVALRTGLVVGSEALLRWFHPELGSVPPSQFIPVAEDAGLIVDIGAWVLRQACEAAAQWNSGGTHEHKVAVNLSAR